MKPNLCPACGTGVPGKDALCDDCAFEYNGTHYGSHDDDETPEQYAKWCLAMKANYEKDRAYAKLYQYIEYLIEVEGLGARGIMQTVTDAVNFFTDSKMNWEDMS